MLDTAAITVAQYDDLLELRDLVHLSGRAEFAEFFKLPVGSVSVDGSAVVGRSGFLFVNDGSNKWREQLLGAEVIADDKRDATLAYLMEATERLRKMSITFRFVVIPEKDVVYSTFSPTASGRIANCRTVHSLSRGLEGVALYPVENLRRLTDTVNTFHARNSHFNFTGGLQIFADVLASLGRGDGSTKIVTTDAVWWPDDLSIKWVDGLVTRRRILRRIYSEDELVASPGHVGRHLVLKNDRAATTDKIIIFGDSYSWNPDAGLARMMTLEFNEVHFVWRKHIDWGLVEAEKPAVVLLESAERFLIKGVVV